ncbi:putative quinol monooxygenase [Trinickia caryophylli]|uniref:Quinol monooxygenase YgiN n=1 Tax=Trinickia caryophylli TaxID=28094 RepID=A0A1X7FCR1_TRICW|nr:putative quinol monooxygenase [Trinickia caryophylli]PMS10993.1 antibiotic biosynthesis monooxygenase [Trinickia caryophylli]TRX18804.1 antibiotic biosynthesis monooxygenase [Trinickia caryophylli]WQE10397.1 putative quinol monooxygenase [Trinickia caryophylli]SMF50097.1 Quinol monooxygenase YgiN [Trinickia caryophylli]GLU34151.1 antibiotic biosynthesis monooxygenase [Trinickia caryophylli]
MSTYIIATVTPKAEHAADVEGALRHMVEVTRKEPGNRRYDLFRETRQDGGVALHLYEIYVDRAAFDAHIASAHFQAFRSKIGDWIAEPPQVRVLDGLDVAPDR